MKLLAIVAHPDDASIFCGGTLAKHSGRGDEVHVAYMTRGGYGGPGDRTEDQIAKMRVQEANAAGKILGVSTSFLGFKDGRIEHSLENRRKVNDAIRKHHPDLLLTHEREDDHPDHRNTGRLVTDACYQASLPMTESDYDPVDPDNIYYFGKPSLDFEPDVFVDVSNQVDTKVEAINCHESQVKFLKEHGGLDRSFDDLVKDVRAEARSLGRKVGCRFAEGFTRLHAEAKDYLE